MRDVPNNFKSCAFAFNGIHLNVGPDNISVMLGNEKPQSLAHFFAVESGSQPEKQLSIIGQIKSIAIVTHFNSQLPRLVTCCDVNNLVLRG